MKINLRGDALYERLGKLGLEVEPAKTKVMEFGRFAVENARKRGERAGDNGADQDENDQSLYMKMPLRCAPPP